MPPYPADVQQSFSLSPVGSPLRMTDQEQDPFAAFNAPAAAPESLQMPQCDDPWAAMTMGGAPPAAAPAPAMAPPAPMGFAQAPVAVEATSSSSGESIPLNNYTTMAPPVAPVPTAMPPAPPVPVPPVAPAEAVPSTVAFSNQDDNVSPPSPMTVAPSSPEQSARFQNQAPGAPPPQVPMIPPAAAPMQAPAPANPFDDAPPPGTDNLANQMNNLSMQQQPTDNYAAMAPTFALATAAPSSMPPAPPAEMPPAPPNAPPSPPNMEMQAPPVAFPNNNYQAPLSPTPLSPVEFAPNNAQDPFGYAFSPMSSPNQYQQMQSTTNQNDMMGRLNAGGLPPVPNLDSSNYNNAANAIVPATNQSADPWGAFGSTAEQPPAPYEAPAVPPPQPQYQAPPVPLAQQQYQAPPVPGASDAMVPSAMQNNDPFGVGAPPATNAMVLSAAQNMDPFGVFDAAPAPPAANADPFGGSTFVDNSSAVVPAAPGQIDDPFGIFGAPTPVAEAPAPSAEPSTSAPVAPAQEDPWADAGFGPQKSNQVTDVASNASSDSEEVPIELDQNSLPKTGEYYECRINAKSLGAMFYTARDLEDSLLYQMPTNVIDAMAKRPVVAYVAQDSAAANSGVHLGHCVLTVNGQEVTNPEECAAMIRQCARPMTLRCYVMPDLELSPAEGSHMVKYDTRDMDPPTSSVEWKAKYVVVGGIITKPWMMMMYYSKVRTFCFDPTLIFIVQQTRLTKFQSTSYQLLQKDYDVAVKETHMNLKCSKKVKQFDLRGARIVLKGKDGKPNTIRYPSEGRPWYFITIVPHKGYPIKISSESLEGLEPVYASVRRFIRRDMEDKYR